MEKNNTEIDLLELFIKVLLHTKKYKWILIGSIIIGFSIAYTVSKFGKNLYKSHITVTTNDKSGLLISLIESLKVQQNTSNLSSSLNISKEIAESIVEIVPKYNVIENENVEYPIFFNIYVTVTDKSFFKDIEKGLQFYAENNSYFKKLEQINNSQRIELINYIDVEINKLDSLRLGRYKSYDIFIENKSTYQNEIINLFEKKQELEKANEISKTFNIVKGFKNTKIPIDSFFKLLLIYVFLMLFIGVLLTIYLELRVLLKKREL